MTQDLTDNYILHYIGNRGYWRILIRPIRFEKVRISLEEARELIRYSEVRLRAWKYPMWVDLSRSDYSRIQNRSNFIECITEHRVNKEIWRLYQSGQFVHRFSFREDWPTYTKRLDALNTFYRITEVFRFASSLVSKHTMYDGGIIIKIGLFDLLDRILVTPNPDGGTFGKYKCRDEYLEHKAVYTKDIMMGDPMEHALDFSLHFFTRFNWLIPDLERLLRGEQENLIKGASWSY